MTARRVEVGGERELGLAQAVEHAGARVADAFVEWPADELDDELVEARQRAAVTLRARDVREVSIERGGARPRGGVTAEALSVELLRARFVAMPFGEHGALEQCARGSLAAVALELSEERFGSRIVACSLEARGGADAPRSRRALRPRRGRPRASARPLRGSVRRSTRAPPRPVAR